MSANELKKVYGLGLGLGVDVDWDVFIKMLTQNGSTTPKEK